jgi:hypothetical protein
MLQLARVKFRLIFEQKLRPDVNDNGGKEKWKVEAAMKFMFAKAIKH